MTLTQRGSPSAPQGVFREELGQIVSGELRGPGGLSRGDEFGKAALSHRGTIDFMDWVFDTFDLDGSEVVGSLSPFFFDIYTLELVLCLANGATLVIIPEQLATFPPRLMSFLRDRSVSFLFWVPSIMVTIAKLGLLEAIPAAEPPPTHPRLHVVERRAPLDLGALSDPPAWAPLAAPLAWLTAAELGATSLWRLAVRSDGAW